MGPRESAPTGDHVYEGRVIVVERTPVAQDVVEFALQRADGKPLPFWSPGSHIDVVLPVGARQYSLVGRSGEDPYRIAVLREDLGAGSTWLHDSAQVGDEVSIKGPRNNFPLEPADSYLFIAGGIGITPLVGMVEGAAARGADWRLHYLGRTAEAMAYRDRLQGRSERVRFTAKDVDGRAIVRDLVEAANGASIYVCGPARLIDEIEAVTAELGLPEVHAERFTPKPVKPDVVNLPLRVHCEKSRCDVDVPADVSILDAIREAGIDVPSSCKEGICGSCETDVIDGVPDHRDSILSAGERERNESMMICVSRARTPELTLYL